MKKEGYFFRSHRKQIYFHVHQIDDVICIDNFALMRFYYLIGTLKKVAALGDEMLMAIRQMTGI